MTEHVTVSIDESTGTIRFLVNEVSENFVTKDSTIRRASHVEPFAWPLRIVFHALRKVFGEDGRVGEWTRSWGCYWRVNLSPVGGPIGNAAIRLRRYAIRAEVAWLEKNFI
jgi:hypothetical protein